MVESKMKSNRAMDIISKIMSMSSYSADNKLECICEVMKHTKRDDNVKYAQGFFNSHQPTFIKLINNKEEEVECDDTLLDDEYFMENYVRLFNKVAIIDGWIVPELDEEDQDEVLVLDKKGCVYE